ncbi:MAG: hypothetical protein HON47_01890 [Candidatus Diapherotrites archaeon]|jgi:hypothetical protein|uniref:Uncharacterized protein n=1 Tax=Candidatus Iainarchaeum sp. TaxID=3101447 RepID=A0A8T5GF22_9ARCH|nr:hypothetical protein [Candidatus Diapherotrites archaeon]MBT7241451.1 hypothetical protein [Candidatus Diapherotrites archaeon]
MKLKIIGILAILFLFALGCTQLPVCGNGICETGESGICSTDCAITLTPSNHISNALLAVRNGGQTTTQSFTLQSNDMITGTNFVADGFDQRSIIIAAAGNGKFPEGKYEVNVDTSSGNGEDFSYFTYTGATDLKSKARVICELTGDTLDDILNISAEYITDAEGLDTAICEGDAIQPCCAIIIQEA